MDNFYKMRQLLIILLLISQITKAQDINLLFPKLYFDSEIDTALIEKNWFGLFKTNDGYSIKNCSIDIIKQYHPMVDNEGEKTGLQVSSIPSDPLILISNLNNTFEQNMAFKELPVKEIYPGDTVTFTFLKTSYSFISTGVLDESGAVKETYRIFLTSAGKMQLIGKSDFFDDAIFNIFWKGDLDGDNQLDIIMDLSHKYSYGLFTLFLSSKAEKGKLLKMVTQHKVYYD